MPVGSLIMGALRITIGVMSTKTPNEKAYEQAQKELDEERVSEVKDLMKTILQKMQDYKDKREEAEEAMRLLKLDLDDLRAGKIDKIKERHQSSKKAREYSIDINDLIAKIKKQEEVNKKAGPNPYHWDVSLGSTTVNNTTNLGYSAPPTGIFSGSQLPFVGFSQTIEPGTIQSVRDQIKEASALHEKLWNDMTSGTYFVTRSDGTTKEFYL